MIVLAGLIGTIPLGCAEIPTIAQKAVLFNGTDFNGWKLFTPDEKVDVYTVWSIKEGVIHCTGVPSGYIRTEADHSNYKLHVEYP